MLLLLAAQALAFTTTGAAWSLDRMPIQVHWTGALDGMTHEEVVAAVEGAAAAWSAVLPCAVAFEVVEDPDAEAWWNAGGDVAFLLGQGANLPADGFEGVVEVTGTDARGGFGKYRPIHPLQVVLVNHGLWRTDADADDTTASLQGVVAHELGHALGLGHSCELGEACGQAGHDAVMFWAGPMGPSTLGDDDIAGIEAIYGGLPLDVDCDPVGDLGVACAVAEAVADLDPRWTFPDGTSADGLTATHELGGPGFHEVELRVASPVCGTPLCDGISVLTNARAADVPQPEPEKGGCASAGSRVTWTWLAGLVGILLGRADRRPRIAGRSGPPTNTPW